MCGCKIPKQPNSHNFDVAKKQKQGHGRAWFMRQLKLIKPLEEVVMAAFQINIYLNNPETVLLDYEVLVFDIKQNPTTGKILCGPFLFAVQQGVSQILFQPENMMFFKTNLLQHQRKNTSQRFE